jgi:hypothetical protein
MTGRRVTDPLKAAALRGKWAEGIRPRHFAWIIKDQLAVCERPGGYGSNHRPVRRLEEIIWIRQQGFDLVVSLIPAPHNLHNYTEEGVASIHRPLTGQDVSATLHRVYSEIHELRRLGKQLIIHQEEFGERVCGFVAGYLVWSGTLDPPPRAITAVEQITARQLGPVAREIVTIAAGLPPEPVPARAPEPAEEPAPAEVESDGAG